MFSKDTFVNLVKKANLVHWSSTKSSMQPLVDALPAGSGVLSRNKQIELQGLIWPVGDNPPWIEKKRKYNNALLYLVTEGLSMPPIKARRVLLKKGESKLNWGVRRLPRDWEFSHTTAATLTSLDPTSSREFCYPSSGLWSDWPGNELVFCLPELDQTKHKQKNFATFGGTKLKFKIPHNTTYLANTYVAGASGEIAFCAKLILPSHPNVYPLVKVVYV